MPPDRPQGLKEESEIGYLEIPRNSKQGLDRGSRVSQDSLIPTSD